MTNGRMTKQTRKCHSERSEAATQRMKSARPGFQSLIFLAILRNDQRCFAPLNMTAPFMPHSVADLNINNLICFQRLTDRDPQQRICLAQTKKRVRFLTTERHEFSVFESAADVMRPIAVAR